MVTLTSHSVGGILCHGTMSLDGLLNRTVVRLGFLRLIGMNCILLYSVISIFQDFLKKKNYACLCLSVALMVV